jgi:putative ABC transport system permease protein
MVRFRPLHRKVLRDLWHLRSQMLAVAVVMACGVAMFVTLRSMHGWLRGTQTAYYAAFRFPQVFAHARRVPSGVAAELARLPGVTGVRTRVVRDVTLDVPGLAEPATGRLVSLPVPRRAILGDVYLREGRWITDRAGEVLASDAFARANGLRVGDSIAAVINGRWQVLTIVGTALSPEYVYEIRGVGDVFPDNRRFGILWMGERALASAFQMEGAFDDVALAIGPDATLPDVLQGVDRVLERYGGTGAYGREDQISHRFLDSEIEETQVTSLFIPTIFLAVTAFLLHIVLVRLVGTQREQIAVLKAFGYGNRTIAAHYVQLALGPIVVGSGAGVAIGLWLAAGLAGVYGRFYQFPTITFTPDWQVVATAVVVSAGASLAGAVGSVRRAVRLPPAEAMRPEAPGTFRPGLLERLGIAERVSAATRIVLRALERRPVKSGLSVLGIAFATAIVVTGWWMFDVIDVMKEIQFEEVDRSDAMVTFQELRGAGAVFALARLDGVRRVESFRAVPARLRHAHRNVRIAVVGLEPEAELTRLVDRNRIRRDAPAGGLALSDVLAARLGIRAGDTVDVEVLEGERTRGRMPVSVVMEDIIGTSAVTALPTLHAFLGEGGTSSGAYLRVDGRRQDSVYRALKAMPAVSGVTIRASVLEGFEKTIAQSFMISITVLLAFACVISAGIVFNGARVALSERGRELASLRVLGFTRAEVTRLLLGEQLLLVLAGIPLGFLLGYGLAQLVSVRFESDLFRIPMLMRRQTYLYAFAVVAAASLLSAWAVRRRIYRLDLVAVLKTRE